MFLPLLFNLFCFCHILTISVLYCAHPCMKCFLAISNFFPILLFSSICLHCSLEKALLSLLAIVWNSAFSLVCLSLSPLPFNSLLFSDICKASSDNNFAFLDFFSCTTYLTESKFNHGQVMSVSFSLS